jgi:hypothetical protein
MENNEVKCHTSPLNLPPQQARWNLSPHLDKFGGLKYGSATFGCATFLFVFGSATFGGATLLLGSLPKGVFPEGKNFANLYFIKNSHRELPCTLFL